VALVEIHQGIKKPSGGMKRWPQELKLRRCCLEPGSRIEQIRIMKCIVINTINREVWGGLQWQLLYTDDLVLMSESEN
jgi:hypothetical protein